ncbi:MAG TPA: AAA family ATPase, partial [Spirochaetota bacterium]|nr:AAA family ATPase [Spirochaetota bacterium]
KFQEAIRTLYEKYKEKVVVLVDEYDKPILDRIDEPEIARENREILKDFYSVLKDTDIYLKLVFLTGVSRFSKVSIFSGLNQLQDITLNPEYATICGYTQRDLETVFEERIKDFDKEEVKLWYNGYNWLGESVYNPFDILLLLSEKRFRSFWFETGTPTFLIKLFQKNSYYLPELENLEVGEEIVSNLDIDNIYPENLLFQAGYLTIKGQIRKGTKLKYILTYPNIEVKISFNDAFLDYLTPSPVTKEKTESRMYDLIEENDIEKLKEVLYSFFASIPLDWYRKNDLESYEGFYASVVYALFNGSGLEVKAEDITNKGRIDLTVFIEERAYMIEFKVVEEKMEGKALQQIKEKRYFEKYINQYKDIYLVGIEFSKAERNIVGFEVEIVKG